jgi:Protein of unknown function (DUF3822)
MRDICFIDKTFDSTQTSNYHLSVQIGLDGLYFTILDLSKGKYILLNGHHFFLKRPRLLLKHVREVFEVEDVLNQTFKSVEILYSTRKFTLVPQAFFKKGVEEKLLWFNNVEERGFNVIKNLFAKAGAYCIFDIPENLQSFLSEKFPKCEIKHTLYPLVEGALKRNWSSAKKVQVYLNFFRDQFELVVVKGSALVYSNMFHYKTERDILYHVLFTFDQLKLASDQSDLILQGQLPQVSPVYHLFKKYVRLTSFARLDTTYQYSYTFSQVPEHYYSTLLSVYKCE